MNNILYLLFSERTVMYQILNTNLNTATKYIKCQYNRKTIYFVRVDYN